MELGPYEVTRDGRVRRSDTLREKLPTINAGGYPVVSIWTNNKCRVCYVHDLVARAFIGEKPRGACVNHLDGNKSNNSVENLEYTTPHGNVSHAMTAGLMRVCGEDNRRAKLTEQQVREIHRRAWAGERSAVLQAEFGVKAPIISQIKHGLRWRHLSLNGPSVQG